MSNVYHAVCIIALIHEKTQQTPGMHSVFAVFNPLVKAQVMFHAVDNRPVGQSNGFSRKKYCFRESVTFQLNKGFHAVHTKNAMQL